MTEFVCDQRTRDGKPCTEPTVFGDHRCAKYHHGKSDGKAAKRRAKLANVVITARPMTGNTFMGDPIDKDPGAALLEEIARTAGHVEWLANKIQTLSPDTLVWGKGSVVTEEKAGGGPTGDYLLKRTENKAELNHWYQLYMQERGHLTRVSMAALKAGVEERRIRLAERGVDTLEAAISAALTDLGLDPSSAHVRAIVGARLREGLGGGQVFETDAVRAIEPPVGVVDGEWYDDDQGPIEGF